MRKLRIGFCVVFLLLCLVPSAGLILAGPSQARANETAARFPDITEDGRLNPDFLSELSDYVSDAFFLRQELITGYARIQALFGQSANEDVVLGREGWLFYGEEMADYAGTDPLTDREIYAAARNILLMQEYSLGLGADFLFFLAPNKSSLYPEYMPDSSAAGSGGNAQRLMEELTEQGAAYVDLFEAFADAGEPLYFAHDSHWNSRGAAYAADAVLRAAGQESSYYEGEFEARQPHTGDLFEMLYPAAQDPETDTPPGGLTFTQPDGTRPDSITIETTGEGEGMLLMFRDSFGELLYPYLADHYGGAYFSRQASYDLTEAASLGADMVMIELVERNISWLTERLPILPAPERTVDLSDAQSGSTSCGLSDDSVPDGYHRVEGVLGSVPDSDSPIYIGFGDSMYEACLAGENGFAACLPGEAAETYVICWKENGVFMRADVSLNES